MRFPFELYRKTRCTSCLRGLDGRCSPDETDILLCATADFFLKDKRPHF